MRRLTRYESQMKDFLGGAAAREPCADGSHYILVHNFSV